MGPSPHLWFCAFTTATLWPELIVSIGARPHLSFCACITARLAPEILVSKGPRPQLSFWAFKITWLASELLVSMSPSTHLWLLHAKQRLLDQNYKSLWVPALICGFCMQNSNFRTRITSRYGFQTLPMVVCIQNSGFSTRITSLYRSQPSCVAFSCKTATFGSELQVSIGPSPHLWVLQAKQQL